MYEVRIHGRGGQGVVTGSERTGAPVVAYCRIAERPIRLREPVLAPDAIVVQDATLLHRVDVLAGLAGDGLVLVNSSRNPKELGLAGHDGQVFTVPASQLARAYLGRPLPNAALLGGLAALCPLVPLAAVVEAIGQRFPGPLGIANVAAATEAFHLVHAQRREHTHA